MSNLFFERPILNSPYEQPSRHWELDRDGQPTQQIIDGRRRSELITPIRQAKSRAGKAQEAQLDLGLDDGISNEKPKYDPTPIINELRSEVDTWRTLPNPNQWPAGSGSRLCCWDSAAGDPGKDDELAFLPTEFKLPPR